MKTYLQILAVFLLVVGMMQAQIKSAKSGVWGADTTWVGGVVPTANDDVVIDTSNTVTVNIAAAACKNLTVKGTITFPDANGLGITINGDCLVEATGKFNTYSSGSPLGIRYQTIVLHKNLTVLTGGTFDMRRGSGATVGVGRVVFAGTANSIISLSQTVYGSSIEEFNSVVINKTGGAKVIIAAGNVFQNNNSTNAPDTLVLISGIIETGNNIWAHLATSGNSIQGASQASYVIGKIGRGITNSGSNANREFPIGDSLKYRPISVRVAGPANATGHYVWTKLMTGNANTGSSTFTGTIDKVSAIRYYEVGYMQNAGSAAAMPAYGFSPTYSTDDGVNAGNMDLRVAYSTDNRVAWKGIGPTNDTTDLTVTPSPIMSDSLSPQISIATGTSLFVALARATGTTTNPLQTGPNSVTPFNSIPTEYSVSQNYPNPFNPSTSIAFELPERQQVKVEIFTLLGTTVAVLQNGIMNAGSHAVRWDASRNPSGVYFYRVSMGNKTFTKRMMLLK